MMDEYHHHRSLGKFVAETPSLSHLGVAVRVNVSQPGVSKTIQGKLDRCSPPGGGRLCP